MSSTSPATLRGGRRPDEPELPTGQLVLQPPPRVPEQEGASGVLMTVIPMLGSLGSILVVATMGGDDRGRSLVAAGMFLLATLGFVVVQVDRQRRQRAQQVTGARTEYLHHLAQVRAVAREAAAQQRRALTWRHPDPASLPALAADRARLWERGPRDPDFLHVRHGLCAQPLSLELVPPESAPVDRVDPAAGSALHRLLAVQRVQPDLPTSVDLRAFGRVELCGQEEPARALARALVCSATASHPPDLLVVAVLCSEATRQHWDWLKWLPHAQSSRRSDAVGPVRLVTTSLDGLDGLLPPDLSDRPRFGTDERPATPHVLLVLDGGRLTPGDHVVPPGGLHGVTLLDLPARWDRLEDAARLRLELLPEPAEPRNDGKVPVRAVRWRERPARAVADQCDLATAEAFARRLTPVRTVATDPGAGHATEAVGPTGLTGLTGMLGLGEGQAFDPAAAWRPRPARDRLRVPIGLGEDGPVHLDLKESAQQGMGPHGLVIGATGSGKSELLRTLVLGLAMTHSPEQLNMVLVDFKGGATFAGMSTMPHVSAVITNLARELTLVDRMQDALSGEMVRRQELLREAGFASVRDHEAARSGGADLPSLPSLFVVVDEFSELLSAKPELVDLFVAVGRLGRSLGLHLLLASQRLEEGRLRGLESHLSYRVGLRTFSAGESRAVLGVPDAAGLPPVPGLGYLKPDPSTLVRFKTTYVSGPAAGPAAGPAPVRREESGRAHGILPFTVAEVPVPDLPSSQPDRAPGPTRVTGAARLSGPAAGEQRSALDVAVDQMAGHGPPAHQVWLPPLDVPDTLDQLLPDLAEDPDLGLASRRWRAPRSLVVPLGTVDRPREQRRDTLAVDLGGAAGHAAVVGGPRSGKSTLLRTIVTSTALVTTPTETQFFVLDFGGGTFAGLARLPHLAGTATRSEPDVVRRVVAEVQGVVDRRETYFRTHGIDSIETYRTRRARGEVDDGWGDVFLVVDGWGTLRADFDDLETPLQQLAARGLTFGLHLVVAATRWADLRAALRDVFGTRLELRLGDPLDSEVDRRVAALVPPGRPGRGLLPGGLHFLAALPRIDGEARPDTLGDGVAHLVARTAAAWPGPTGPKLRLLPELVGLDRVREQARSAGVADRLLVLGVDEELAPVTLDVDAEPHLLVFGDGRSGKSTLLRTYLHEVVRSRTAQQAQVVVVDHRRSLLGEVPDDHLLNYLTSAAQATPVLRDLAAYLETRVAPPDVTPEQLRHRSWWDGAEVFVVVDDYDLVATQQGSPVAALQPLLAQARDVGLHVVVARRSGGASRALYEPVVQSLRDLAAPGVLLSGRPEEGPLVGGLKPAPARPGRARLLTRDRGVETVQLARTDGSG